MSDFANMTALPDDDEPVAPPQVMDMDVDVQWKAQHITRLHLCEPTGKQIETAEREISGRDPSPYMMRRYQITLISQVAKVPREVVENLRVSQIEDAFDFLSGLLQRGRQTGES